MFNKYNRIDTIEKLEKLDSYLISPDNTHNFTLISYDTETNGLLLYKSVIIGFSISTDTKSGFYIPLLEWKPDPKSLKTRKVDKVPYESYMEGCFKDVWSDTEYPEFVTPDQYKVPDFIVAYMTRWFSGVNLIMHNAPFDVNMTFINTGLDLKDQVFMDTALLVHILNENSPNALKRVAEEWREELGINPHVMANIEQQELKKSIIINGGKNKEVWRADNEYQSKYAVADTFLTFGVFEVGMKKFVEEFGEDKLAWLLEEEVMPLCKEVAIPMKRKGVYLDVPHFEQLQIETKVKMLELEDSIMDTIGSHLSDFTLGKSMEEAVSNNRFIRKIIELENLTIPKKLDKASNIYKETLGKPDIKKRYQEEPHWIWGYILGEDEIKYSDTKIRKIKADLYNEVVGRRYPFNIQSDAHLRWLFCEKLGFDAKELPQTDSATKTNPIPSMTADILKETMLPKQSWVKHLLTYKRLLKLYSTYITPAIELNLNGWLYMDMRQNGTVSGRFACSGGFNLQTLPKTEELDTCSKCDSKNITMEHSIALLVNVTCSDCGHVEEDVVHPSAIKKGFITPPGYKIVNADYSSLEPRCFAYMSNDPKLIEVYTKNLDLYSKVYCDMFDDKKLYSADPKADNFLKKLNPQARTMIKPVCLGIPYGAQAAQVARLTNNIDEDGKPDFSTGQLIIDRYLRTFKDLTNYMKNMEINCIEKGYVESLIGRRRHFVYSNYVNRNIICRHIKGDTQAAIEMRHKIFSDFILTPNSQLNKMEVTVKSKKSSITHILTRDALIEFSKEFKIDMPKIAEKGFWSYVKSLVKQEYNNAKNFPIQSLAGHITNKGMLDTTRYFNQCKLDAWVALQVHDEITCYAKDEQAEDAAAMLQAGMENNDYAKRVESVKMIAEPTVCNNLKDAK